MFTVHKCLNGSTNHDAEVTSWTTADGRTVHTAATVEPVSGGVITGWSLTQIDNSTARSLVDLVANATSALRAALHLQQAEFAANHVSLTSLSTTPMATRLVINCCAQLPSACTHSTVGGDWQHVMAATNSASDPAMVTPELLATTGRRVLAALTLSIVAALSAMQVSNAAFSDHSSNNSSSFGAATSFSTALFLHNNPSPPVANTSAQDLWAMDTTSYPSQLTLGSY